MYIVFKALEPAHASNETINIDQACIIICIPIVLLIKENEKDIPLT